MAELPTPLARWLGQLACQAVRPGVWRLAHPAAYLKQHRQQRKFVQERDAYLHWAPRLSQLPTLLAYCNGLKALLLSALPGEPSAAPAAFYQAGRWLAALHALPYDDRDPLPLELALKQRLAAWRRRAPLVVPAELWARLTACGDEALAALGTLRRVPCHRDYTPHNWLVDRAAQRFYVIDFEHARADYWLWDVARLASEGWLLDGRRAEAFWAGYGCRLSAAENQLLAALSAQLALAAIGWAEAHHDRQLAQRSWVALNGLLRAAALH